ncbi:PDZ domain-containing protein [Synechococcus sp. WH 8016]|uniref:PDZ domain-containing protein n=1 Tax=Synechococcus sp. WH 8016 TaxID=166318 RepID=UPI001145B5F6|nr:PDZ domain-containing protein [Synechococcus sp. WH 8016]
MKGETSTETTVNQIQRQGANLTEGNSCPAGLWYSGGGYCQRVICIKSGLFGYGNDPQLAGKGIKCRGGAEIHWDKNSQPVRASFDKTCPPGDLAIGFQNTCAQGMARGYATFYSSGYRSDQNNIVNKVFGDPAKGKLQAGDKVITINGVKNKEYVNDAQNPTSIQILIERQGEQLEFTWTTKLQRVELPKAKNL